MEARDERKKLESELADLQHETMLRDRYPDPVIRKLIERMEKNEDLDEIVQDVMAGGTSLRDVEELEVELDDICQALAKEQEDGSDSNSGDPENIKEEDNEREEEREDDEDLGGVEEVEADDAFEVAEEIEGKETMADAVELETAGADTHEDVCSSLPTNLRQADQSPSLSGVIEDSIKEEEYGADKDDDMEDVSINAEPKLKVEMDGKNMSMKSEVRIKDESDIEDEGRSTLTEAAKKTNSTVKSCPAGVSGSGPSAHGREAQT